jgi:hypothetical protein
MASTPLHQLLQSPAPDGKLNSSGDWQLDPTELASKFSPRTKALVLNTPNNPLGKVPGKPLSRVLADWVPIPALANELPWGLSFFICELVESYTLSSEN